MKTDDLKCGECGGETFTLTHALKEKEDYIRVGGQGFGGFPGRIIVTCTRCKAESVIEPAPAKLMTYGPLCGGWK